LYMEANGTADIHVHGNVTVSVHSGSTSSDAEPVTGIRAVNGGTVVIDGDFSSISSGTVQNRFQLISENGSTLKVGNVNFDNTGSIHGWIDIYNDHDGGMQLGNINITVGQNAD